MSSSSPLFPPPEPPFPQASSPRMKLSRLRLVAPALVLVLLVAAFAGISVLRGAGNTPRTAAGLSATPTSAMTATETTATGTASPGAIPTSTVKAVSGGGPAPQTDPVRVTKNQDMRPLCASDPVPYTVELSNSGTVTATWHVYVPAGTASAPGGSPPLAMPLQGPVVWGNPVPQDGTIAPGQTASFMMYVFWPMPCGGTTYHASVQLSFPSGISQPDIPLSYAGTGAARYSKVVLVSGSMNMTQPCPASGNAPAPYTFTLTNTGNYPAVFMGIVPFDMVGSTQWATLQYVYNPAEPRTDWLYPGQKLTVTVSPVVGVSCGGTVYRIDVSSTDPNGTQETMTLTDTFN